VRVYVCGVELETSQLQDVASVKVPVVEEGLCVKMG
jgi:hypothetical protein